MSRRLVALALAVILAATYVGLLRRRILNWGATDSEARSRLPGDELLENADGISTRAISINAPVSAVWPWLAQLGPSPRGGAYTYDWIENLLGLNMHSADHILEQFQHPEVGETIGFGSNQMRLERVEPDHVLAWRSQDGNWVWTFVLESQEGGTRLISRNRFRLRVRNRTSGDAADGACLAGDGAEDAARHQAACRESRALVTPIAATEARRAACLGEVSNTVGGAPRSAPWPSP